MLRDPYGRLVDYLCVSVTDRCDDTVADLFREAVRTKPQGHDLCAGGDVPSPAEPMSRVGG